MDAAADNGRFLLDNCFLFRDLNAEERVKIATYAHVQHYKPGATIFLRGAPGSSLMAVSKGEIRISCHSSDGKEAVLAIFRSGDVFGEIALLDGKERTTDATAITACELVVLERRDIMPVLEQQPKICLKLMDALCQRLRRTNDQVLDVLFFQLPIRLAKALLRTAGRRISATKRETLHVRVSQRELGAMIGATRESVNKCLSEWQRQGIIEVKAGVIIILEVAELTRISEVQ